MIHRNITGRATPSRQDPECPLLINIKDFRLLPNIPRLGGQKEDRAAGKVYMAPHRDYRPYRGDPKATVEERRRMVETGTSVLRPPVVDTSPQGTGNFGSYGVVSVDGESEPFDIGKANKDELVAFAKRWFGEDMDPNLHIMKMRVRLRDAAKALEAADGKNADDLA